MSNRFDISDFVSSRQKLKQFEELHWVGTFQDYLDVVLRVHENEGRAARVTIDLPAELPEAEITYLLGQPADDPRVIEREGNALSFDIGPWEIVTLRFPSPEARGQFPFGLPPDEPAGGPSHPRWKS